jgi:origin recognition complex subunit 2
VAQILEENDSSGADFSDSGSEYVNSDEESETEVTSESSESSENETEQSKNTRKVVSKQSLQSKKVNNKSYTIKTDDYFSNHTTKKILTSNHTLDKLETPRLPQDQLQKLLSKMKLGSEHETAINKLVSSNYSYFDKWMYLMHENINILLYGLGSKKEILDTFHEKYLKKLPTIVVNGFFPSLSIKDVLDGIIINLLELKENPANVYEACDLIEREFSYILDTHLYLIIHNIDMMRSGKAQSVFARLAAVSNIHLIASIDHINAPLIWDHSKLSKFNFTWWDVTTFHPYIDETSFESSMMVQRTGTLALSSLRNVFLSLTSNSKGIYLILVKYQIENGKKQYYQGNCNKI